MPMLYFFIICAANILTGSRIYISAEFHPTLPPVLPPPGLLIDIKCTVNYTLYTTCAAQPQCRQKDKMTSFYSHVIMTSSVVQNMVALSVDNNNNNNVFFTQ